jgi:hypothetical protein
MASTNNNSETSADPGGFSPNQTLVITLSTVLSVVGVAVIAITAYCVTRNCRKRRRGLFNRGITPIGDDEIASWKLNRCNEKEAERYTARPSSNKAPSLIQYQNGGRPSLEVSSPLSPLSYSEKRSMSFDLPRAPEGAVLARAPNARSGLTDETVPGDQPFVPTPRRNPSKLSKQPPSPPMNIDTFQIQSQGQRLKGPRSNSMRSAPESRQRTSSDTPPSSRGGHSRIYSSSAIPPAVVLSEAEQQFAGLSPPPNRRAPIDDIGRAIG